MKFRSMKEEQPEDGQPCLTRMKHGIIEGTYFAKEDVFRGYYFGDLEWIAYEWLPIEEFE